MNRFFKSVKLGLGSLLACSVLVGSPVMAQQQRISISTGGTGGVWYPIGGAMAAVLSKQLPNTAATAEVTGGSVDNLKLIGSKRSDIGFTMVDAGFEAVNGAGKFQGSKVGAKTLAAVQPLVMHIVTLDGSSVKTVADLKGKRVSTGSPGSGSEVMALRILQAAGIDPAKDVTRERLSVAEAANALRDRKIDAFMHAAGMPIPSVTDIASSPGLKIRLIDHSDVLEKMKAQHGPIYSAGKIPAKTYANQDRDVNTVNVWGILVVNESMPDAQAYNIVKTLFANQADLVRAHREAANMTLANQVGTSPIPFHPGAAKFFAEQGVKLQ